MCRIAALGSTPSYPRLAVTHTRRMGMRRSAGDVMVINLDDDHRDTTVWRPLEVTSLSILLYVAHPEHRW